MLDRLGMEDQWYTEKHLRFAHGIHRDFGDGVLQFVPQGSDLAAMDQRKRSGQIGPLWPRPMASPRRMVWTASSKVDQGV